MSSESVKKKMQMDVIYKALEDGWSVKKMNNEKTFEFTKKQNQLEEKFKGLVIFSKNKTNICEDIQKHIENLDVSKDKKYERSFSVPNKKSGLN